MPWKAIRSLGQRWRCGWRLPRRRGIRSISDLTRMEALVGPLKSSNATVETSFHAFFARSDVRVVAITAAVCDRAARIRATHNFKPMDALQLAAAVEHGANVFLTADARLRSFTGLTVEVLS